MLKLLEVTCKNFMSFGNVPTVVDLDQQQTVMIIGNNKDVGEEGNSRNGVGKTTLIQGIVYGLYGKGIDKLKSDEFINLTNGKQLEVNIKFSSGKNTYRVKRGRKPNVVELYQIDGEEEISLTRDSMKNTDDLITEIIGIPYEVFVGVYFMSPHKESFMSMTGPEQRSFIENVLSLDVLAKRAETLKTMRKEVQAELKAVEREFEVGSERNVKIQGQIDDTETKSATWEQSKKQKIVSLNESLETYKDFDADKLTTRLGLVEELSNKISELDRNINENAQACRENERYINGLIGIKSSIEDTQKKEQAYFDDLNAQASEVEAKIETYDADKISKDIEIYDSLQPKQLKTTSEIRDIEREIATSESQIKRTTESLESKISEVEELESGKCPYCKQDHYDADKVESLVGQCEQLESKLSELEQIVNTLSQSKSEKQTELDEVNQSLSEIDVSSLRRQENELVRLFDKQEDLEEKLQQVNPHSQHIEVMLTKESVENVEEFDELIDAAKDKLSALEVEKVKLSDEKVKLSDELAQTKAGLSVSSVAEVNRMVTMIDNIKHDLDTVTSSENPYSGQIDGMKELFIDLDQLQSDKDDLTKIEGHMGYLVKLLTDPKSFVRKNILEQYIPFLNKKILEYTTKLDLPHVGTISSDLSVDLTYMGKSVSYYNTSRGERLRLDIATTAAFKDLMKLMGKDCNMLMVDELFDGSMDSSGMFKSFNFVKDRAEHVWLVSHRDELVSRVDKKMEVTKQNGFTTIEFTNGS